MNKQISTFIQYKFPLSLCLFIPYVYGADDSESWTSVSFERRLPYSLKLEFEQELRLADQVSTFKQTFSELSLSYKVFEGFNIQIPFRYSTFKDKNKQRIGFGGSYKYSFKPLSLKYRGRIQRTFEEEKEPEDLIRNRCTIAYKINKKIEPFLYSEVSHSYLEEPAQLEEYRISFGVSVDLKKKNSIKVFYIFKKDDLSRPDPVEISVFGLAFNKKM